MSLKFVQEERNIVFSSKDLQSEKSNNVCANCQFCEQYFTGDQYPEFGCKNREGCFKEDFMGYPSTDEGCDYWEQNYRNSWMD